MAYSTDKLIKLAGAGPTAPQLWLYGPVAGGTQTDAVATVRGAGYISDAGPGAGSSNRGMRLNDIVIVVDTSTPLVSFSRVSALSAANGGATLTA